MHCIVSLSVEGINAISCTWEHGIIKHSFSILLWSSPYLCMQNNISLACTKLSASVDTTTLMSGGGSLFPLVYVSLGCNYYVTVHSCCLHICYVLHVGLCLRTFLWLFRIDFFTVCLFFTLCYIICSCVVPISIKSKIILPVFDTRQEEEFIISLWL